MRLLETQHVLKVYRDLIIEEAKANLAKPQGKFRKPKNASGTLSDSIQGTDKFEKGKLIEAGIQMEAYGEFIDKGVSGVKKKYDTPYSYKDRMPPANKLDKWTVRRGIAPRDAKGKFIPRKSLLWLISRGIYNNGIKPSLFMTKPFEKYMDKLPVELATAFTEDSKVYLELQLKDLK